MLVANRAGLKKVAVMDKSLYITYVETCWILFFQALPGEIRKAFRERGEHRAAFIR